MSHPSVESQCFTEFVKFSKCLYSCEGVGICNQKVAYPVVFDAYDFCTPELKEQLEAPRKVIPPPLCRMTCTSLG